VLLVLCVGETVELLNVPEVFVPGAGFTEGLIGAFDPLKSPTPLVPLNVPVELVFPKLLGPILVVFGPVVLGELKVPGLAVPELGA
jgi:hypothetical protein